MQAGETKLKFGVFEVWLEQGELRKQGMKLNLTDKPFKLLAALLKEPGSLVTREALREHLWADDTYVDFDNNLNGAVRRLRRVLGDSANSPRFIETVPRRGYRFIAPVEGLVTTEPESKLTVPVEENPPMGSRAGSRPSLWTAFGAVVAIFLVAMLLPKRENLPPSKHMLAVLPFSNLSDDPNQEFFSDGLTEEMIARLGGLDSERLGVIARTSVMGYKNTTLSAAEIGAALDVAFLVEGSVRRVDQTVRVTAQLIRVSDQTHLWAETWDRPLTNLLAVQTEMGRLVATSLSLKLLEPRPLPPARPEVLDAYWKGRYHWHKQDKESLTRGLEWFAKAIEMDPRFAPAWAGMADSHNSLALCGSGNTADHYRDAREAAQQALAIDENLAEAHAALGYTLMSFDWDWVGAEKAFTRALTLNPGRAVTHHWAAGYFSARGRKEEALAEVERVHSLDPLSHRVTADLGWFCYYAGRYELAIRYCRRTLELEPNAPSMGLCLALSLHQMGLKEKAVLELEDRWIRLGLSEEKQASLSEARAREGFIGTWRWLAETQQKTADEGGAQPHYILAVAYSILGDYPRAYIHIDKAIAKREAWVPYLSVDPIFAPMRSDPRFRAIADHLLLPQQP